MKNLFLFAILSIGLIGILTSSPNVYAQSTLIPTCFPSSGVQILPPGTGVQDPPGSGILVPLGEQSVNFLGKLAPQQNDICVLSNSIFLADKIVTVQAEKGGVTKTASAITTSTGFITAPLLIPFGDPSDEGIWTITYSFAGDSEYAPTSEFGNGSTFFTINIPAPPPPLPTTLKITKNTIGSDGSFLFNLDSVGGQHVLTIPDTNTNNMFGPILITPNVEYSITEANLPSIWTQVFTDCEINGVSIGGTTFTPSAGNSVECTFVNEFTPTPANLDNICENEIISTGTFEKMKVAKGTSCTITGDTIIEKNLTADGAINVIIDGCCVTIWIFCKGDIHA